MKLQKYWLSFSNGNIIVLVFQTSGNRNIRRQGNMRAFHEAVIMFKFYDNIIFYHHMHGNYLILHSSNKMVVSFMIYNLPSSHHEV